MMAATGFYLYQQKQASEQPIVVAKPIEPEPKKTKQVVIIKAYVTVCEKLSVAMPLDTGVTSTSEDTRVMKGYVENRGNTPVHFVEVRLMWLNDKKRVLQEDDMFAVTEAPLMPGEKAYFQSTQRNILIQKCNVKVNDWWVYQQKEEDAKPEATPEPSE